MLRSVAAKKLKDALPGIQLAVFEIVWPVFGELKQVLIRVGTKGLDVYCYFNRKPTAYDQADCKRLVTEVLDIAFEKPPMAFSFKFGISAPAGPYSTVMSQRLFTKIATEIAPWRLKAGR